MTDAVAGESDADEVWFDLYGNRVAKTSADLGVYIVKKSNSFTKILKR